MIVIATTIFLKIKNGKFFITLLKTTHVKNKIVDVNIVCPKKY